MKYLFTVIAILFTVKPFGVCAQQFYRVGAEENITTEPEFGILLAGGASDNDDGMTWLIEKANGGDVVVLRASGGDLYNDYIYSDLGVEVNSVTSIVIIGSSQANNPAVCEAVEQSEVIFLAGGDQWYYYDEWKGTCLHHAINQHVNEKGGAIGGTSAGLAVLGEVVFTAQNGTLTSEQALGNPYHNRVTLSKDFLDIPYMENLVTDSHYDERDRQGRHAVFLARMMIDWGMENVKGIGVDEYTAVGVDANGIARVFGHPSWDDNAYFIKANALPEQCESGVPLTWDNQGKALTVYKVKGDFEGSNTFNLANWQQGQGGDWYHWYVVDGELFFSETTHTRDLISLNDQEQVRIFPNPATTFVNIEMEKPSAGAKVLVSHMSGKVLKSIDLNGRESLKVDISDFSPGVYIITRYCEEGVHVKKFVKK